MPPPDDFPLAVAIREAIDEAEEGAHLDLVDARPPEFSDESLALQFSARHANDLQYVAMWGRWVQWRAPQWRADETLHVFDLARAVCRSASAIVPPNDKKLAAAVASAKTVAAVERLAKADRRHAATTSQWDQDAWLFLSAGET